jgi:hypothetical protein
VPTLTSWEHESCIFITLAACVVVWLIMDLFTWFNTRSLPLNRIMELVKLHTLKASKQADGSCAVTCPGLTMTYARLTCKKHVCQTLLIEEFDTVLHIRFDGYYHTKAYCFVENGFCLFNRCHLLRGKRQRQTLDLLACVQTAAEAA